MVKAIARETLAPARDRADSKARPSTEAPIIFGTQHVPEIQDRYDRSVSPSRHGPAHQADASHRPSLAEPIIYEQPNAGKRKILHPTQHILLEVVS